MRYVLQAVKTLLSVAYIGVLDFYSLVRGAFYRPSERVRADAVELVRQLRERGFIVLEDYYSAEQVDGILAMARTYMQDEFGDFDHINREAYYRCPEAGQSVDGGVFRLFAPGALEEATCFFADDAYLVDLIENAYRTRIVRNGCVVQRNLPVGSETRSFHVDMYAPKQFKAFLFLTDVLDESQGPYAVIEGSHRWRWRQCWNFLTRGLAAKHDLTSFSQLRSADLQRAHLFKVRRGTVVLATQQAIHRGWPLTVGERFALVNYYVEQMPSGLPGYRVNRRLGYRYADAQGAERTR